MHKASITIKPEISDPFNEGYKQSLDNAINTYVTNGITTAKESVQKYEESMRYLRRVALDVAAYQDAIPHHIESETIHSNGPHNFIDARFPMLNSWPEVIRIWEDYPAVPILAYRARYGLPTTVPYEWSTPEFRVEVESQTYRTEQTGVVKEGHFLEGIVPFWLTIYGGDPTYLSWWSLYKTLDDQLADTEIWFRISVQVPHYTIRCKSMIESRIDGSLHPLAPEISSSELDLTNAHIIPPLHPNLQGSGLSYIYWPLDNIRDPKDVHIQSIKERSY